MTRRGDRLALWLVALLLCLPFFIKGRVPPPKGDAAFLRATTSTVLVRLAGEVPRPGLYRFPRGATVATVTKMTLFTPQGGALPGVPAATALASGDILTLSFSAPQVAVLSLGKMQTSERMLLRIPLNPDEMGLSDWCALPGIGPVLGARIVADRQENGAFGSLEGVLRVRGVGPGKISRIRKYF